MSRPQIAALQWKLSLNIAQLLAILLTVSAWKVLLCGILALVEVVHIKLHIACQQAFGCGIAASVIFGPNQGAASPWIQRASASKDALSTGDTPPATCKYCSSQLRLNILRQFCFACDLNAHLDALFDCSFPSACCEWLCSTSFCYQCATWAIHHLPFLQASEQDAMITSLSA